jgi:hypothetical protein
MHGTGPAVPAGIYSIDSLATENSGPWETFFLFICGALWHLMTLGRLTMVGGLAKDHSQEEEESCKEPRG